MDNLKSKISGLLPKRVKKIIRLVFKKKVSPDRPSNLGITSLGRLEVAYRKGTADEAVLAHSSDYDIFFTGTPEYQPAEDHVIIDVGAHIGTFSLRAGSMVPKGKVYAIEPCEDSFTLLRINVP
jgi:hypothetical protein